MTSTTGATERGNAARVAHSLCAIPGTRAKKSPRRVLVVDDEALIRWSAAQALTELDIQVEQAADGASARTAIAMAERPFDVIVLDLRLPDVDDLSLLAEVLQNSPGTAVVLMTAFGTEAIIDSAYRLGVHMVLNKPFELDAMCSAVLAAARAAP